MSTMYVAWFASTLAISAAIPGPAVMATVSRVLSRGERGALAFCLGIVLGDLVWLWTATLGLSAAASVVGPLVRWGELAGAAYLLVLSWKMWRIEPVVATGEPVADAPRAGGLAAFDGRAVLSALALQLGNPKAVLFYAALVPAMVPVASLTARHLLVLSAIVTAVILGVNLGYVRGASLARRFLRSPRALRITYRVNASVLAALAVFVAWSTVR